MVEAVKVEKVERDKERYMPLLLLADPDEGMIGRYLPKGDMFILLDGFSGSLRSICVVVEVESHVCELKNLATLPAYQHQGYGRRLVTYICRYYHGRYERMLVGTGDSPLTIPFYESCGFRRSHVVKNFFTDNYPQPIIEDGVVLRDMVYLAKEL